MRDVAQRPTTATMLKMFAMHFSNGALPKDLWTYLKLALMHLFQKKTPEERVLEANPALGFVTMGFVLTRFGC